jgi:hypothetical protein
MELTEVIEVAQARRLTVWGPDILAACRHGALGHAGSHCGA